MAFHWVKVCVGIHEKRETVMIAKAMGRDRLWVVGALVRLWSWADGETADGSLDGVGLEDIDAVVGVDGFGAAVEKAGWIRVGKRGVTIPNFDRHNGESAKRRALTKNRVEKHRDGGGRFGRVTPPALPEGGSCNAPSVTDALLEKRREEEEKTDRPALRSGRSEKTSTTTTHARRAADGGHPAPVHGPATPQIEDGWTAGLDLWTGLREAWNAAPWVKRWDGFDFSRGDLLAARLADPDWVRMYPDALARLERCRFFDTPVTLLQFLGPTFVGNVLAGAYDHRRGRNGKPIVDSDALPF